MIVGEQAESAESVCQGLLDLVLSWPRTFAARARAAEAEEGLLWRSLLRGDVSCELGLCLR